MYANKWPNSNTPIIIIICTTKNLQNPYHRDVYEGVQINKDVAILMVRTTQKVSSKINPTIPTFATKKIFIIKNVLRKIITLWQCEVTHRPYPSAGIQKKKKTLLEIRIS